MCIRDSKYRIKTHSAEKIVMELSGGNQQKVILGRWMLADLKVLILFSVYHAASGDGLQNRDGQIVAYRPSQHQSLFLPVLRTKADTCIDRCV